MTQRHVKLFEVVHIEIPAAGSTHFFYSACGKYLQRSKGPKAVPETRFQETTCRSCHAMGRMLIDKDGVSHHVGPNQNEKVAHSTRCEQWVDSGKRVWAVVVCPYCITGKEAPREASGEASG